MTREEQIKKAAHDFSWGWCDDKAHPLNDGFIEGAKWADSHPQWIPVEERLPEKDNENSKFSETVLVYNKDGYKDTAYYDYESKIWRWMSRVTHWMPLPKAPRKEDK